MNATVPIVAAGILACGVLYLLMMRNRARTGQPRNDGMATQHTYCPVCGASIQPDATNCPRCNADIDEWNRKGFVEKLIEALKHPLSDIRMRAIIVLGKRRERSAEQALVDCAMAYPSDVVQGLEVVNSLRLIREGESTSWALEKLAKDHLAHAIREAAVMALKQLQ
jgi:hypothetical protein